VLGRRVEQADGDELARPERRDRSLIGPHAHDGQLWMQVLPADQHGIQLRRKRLGPRQVLGNGGRLTSRVVVQVSSLHA